jgi:hypothetical protein
MEEMCIFRTSKCGQGVDTKTKQVGVGAGRNAFSLLGYFQASRWRLYIHLLDCMVQ